MEVRDQVQVLKEENAVLQQDCKVLAKAIKTFRTALIVTLDEYDGLEKYTYDRDYHCLPSKHAQHIEDVNFFTDKYTIALVEKYLK